MSEENFEKSINRLRGLELVSGIGSLGLSAALLIEGAASNDQTVLRGSIASFLIGASLLTLSSLSHYYKQKPDDDDGNDGGGGGHPPQPIQPRPPEGGSVREVSDLTVEQILTVPLTVEQPRVPETV